SQAAWPPPPPADATLTLTDTIYGVLRHHRELRGMQEDRQVLTHELRRARAGFGPSVDLQGSAGTAIISDSSTRRHDLDRSFLGVVEGSARLTQPIWDGFATRSRVRSAMSTLQSVKDRVYDTATTLSLDGIIAQINLLRQRKIYALAKANVEKHKEILGQTSERSQFGADTEADVSQAQSRLSRALSSLSEAQANLLIAEDTYTRLTGLPPAVKMAPVEMPPVVFDGPKPVFEMAELHNPKLAAYMQDIRALQADKQLAESTFYPTLNAEVGPSYSNRNRYDDRWTWDLEAVGTMRWNIFNSGADVAERKAAMARIREARQTLYDYIDTLRLDIQSTWINYLAARDQFTHYSEAVKHNEFTRVAYLEQFQMGQRSLLDVLDAENELYNSATQAETAAGNILVGAYRLCALTGNLLPIMKIDIAPLHLNPERDAKDPREEFDLGWFQ
ncbi:MAG: TolC family protein, partial [Desulfovibrio sp.]|nr:TolC family protein [Desulfovibrio sp.]